MADCLYHGQSSPGPCPQCESNRRAGRRADEDPPLSRREISPEEEAERMKVSAFKIGEVLSDLTLEERLTKQKERQAHRPDQIDNSRLYAGSAMFYYCRTCGAPSAKLNESHSEPAPRFCSECTSLDRLLA